MKDLENKLKELEEGLKNMEWTIDDIKGEITYCKENKKEWFSYEMLLSKVKEHKKEIEREIYIINNAMDILEGIGE